MQLAPSARGVPLAAIPEQRIASCMNERLTKSMVVMHTLTQQGGHALACRAQHTPPPLLSIALQSVALSEDERLARSMVVKPINGTQRFASILSDLNKVGPEVAAFVYDR